MDIEIGTSIKGNVGSGATVQIVQTCNVYQEPLLKMGNEYLLFTEKYSGSIAENAYVAKGLHHGIYRLDDEVFKDLSDLNSTLKDEIESYSFTEIKNLILSLE